LAGALLLSLDERWRFGRLLLETFLVATALAGFAPAILLFFRTIESSSRLAAAA
jgi:hypothetical protein